MRNAVILDAVRTPIGKRNGALKDWRPDDLMGFLLQEMMKRHQFSQREVEDVILGCVTQIREQGLNIARIAALIAGFPVDVPGTSVNRQCGSGLQAVNFAAQAIMSGMHDLIIAGGVESMTRVPMLSDGAEPSEKLVRRFDIVPQGISAELIAERWGFTREQLDQFSLESHQKAAHATKNGYFKREIIPVPIMKNDEITLFTEDEGIRYDTSLEKMAKLRPAFKEDGMITAGNSSQISDGAAAVLLASEEKANDLGIKPRARIVITALAAVDPTIMLTAPMPASKRALKKAKLTIDDIDVIEVNEAFAPVPLAFIHDLKPEPRKINPNGGAIALGHPLGCTGARLVTTALHELERINGKYALITLCIGFGQGIATIIERT